MSSVFALLGLGLTARELFQAPVPPPNFIPLPGVSTQTPLGIFWEGNSAHGAALPHGETGPLWLELKPISQSCHLGVLVLPSEIAWPPPGFHTCFPRMWEGVCCPIFTGSPSFSSSCGLGSPRLTASSQTLSLDQIRSLGVGGDKIGPTLSSLTCPCWGRGTPTLRACIHLP